VGTNVCGVTGIDTGTWVREASVGSVEIRLCGSVAGWTLIACVGVAEG
jgi:hypothetical protein